MSQFGSDSNPPVSSEFGIPTEPPGWPKVVGIISIVWGSLLVLCNVCGLASQAMSGAIVNMMPPESREQMKQQMAASQNPLQMGLYAVSALSAMLLLAAGIQTVRRQASGRPMHLAWGAISIVLAIVGGVLGAAQMKTQIANQAQSNPQVAQAQQMGMTFGYVMFGCIMIFVLIWPIFSLVWFGPMGKRPEAGAGNQEPLV